jgi:NADP-dependent 3-hydroxy acid dehydrogenase YdfG
MAAEFNQWTAGEEDAKAYSSRCESETCLFFSTPQRIHRITLTELFEVTITGASEGGIGAATAIALAYGKPRTLFFTCRDPSKTAPVIEAIRNVDLNIKTIFVNLDLADQESIREAARTIQESGDVEKIYGLINNVGD